MELFRLSRSLVLISLCAGVPITLLHAQPSERIARLQTVQFVDDIGAAERIEVADLLVTLTQEIAAAACHKANRVAVSKSEKMFAESLEQFDLYLTALKFGDPRLNIIGEENNRRTLKDLELVSGMWTDVKAAALTLTNDPNDPEAIALIKAQNMPLHDATAHLLSELQAEYTNPAELLQVDALMIQFAGRQAMLAQKMAKESCQIWAGNSDPERKEALLETMNLYKLTLTALHDGMAAVGIPPAPTEEIKLALETEMDRWIIIEQELNVVLETGDKADDVKAQVYLDLADAMYRFEEIAHLYVVFAKHDYNG